MDEKREQFKLQYDIGNNRKTRMNRVAETEKTFREFFEMWNFFPLIILF